MERRTGRRSNFSQSRTKKNCYGAGVKNFAYYAIFLPFFLLLPSFALEEGIEGGGMAVEGERERGEGGLAKAPKPQVVVTIKGESRNLS